MTISGVHFHSVEPLAVRFTLANEFQDTRKSARKQR